MMPKKLCLIFITVIGVLTLSHSEVRYFGTIANMLSATPANGDVFLVSGYKAANDGGGGTFIYNSGTSGASDGGVVLHRTSPTGTYTRTQVTNINVVMFGANGKDDTDDAPAFGNAINYCKANGFKTLYIPAGIYHINSVLPNLNRTGAQDSMVSVVGEGSMGSTTLVGSDLGDKTGILQTSGGSGKDNSMEISNINFLSTSVANSVGVKIGSSIGVRVNNCRFGGLKYGVMLANQSGASFTEYAVIRECWFSECETALVYTRESGSSNDSFHGSGLVNCRINHQRGASGPQILIGIPADDMGERFMVYNAPMDFQIWTRTGSTQNNYNIIKSNAGSGSAFTTHGMITIETTKENGFTTPPPKLYSGGPLMYHVGGISSLGENGYSTGDVRLADRVQVGATGVITPQLKPFVESLDITPAASATTLIGLQSAAAELGAFVSITVVGPPNSNYDARYLLYVSHSGYSGQAGTVNVVSTVRWTSHSWGQPAFTMDANGQLIMTNSNFQGQAMTIRLNIMPAGGKWQGFQR